eukprot:1137726-Pelagomonas_calceolata.AAC.6
MAKTAALRTSARTWSHARTRPASKTEHLHSMTRQQNSCFVHTGSHVIACPHQTCEQKRALVILNDQAAQQGMKAPVCCRRERGREIGVQQP